MKAKNAKKIGKIIGVSAAILAYLVLCAISWGVTCGIIKLVTLCFGWVFTWKMATGIWLIMYLVRSVFNRTSGK